MAGVFVDARIRLDRVSALFDLVGNDERRQTEGKPARKHEIQKSLAAGRDLAQLLDMRLKELG
jgi:hypothetical protein